MTVKASQGRAWFPAQRHRGWLLWGADGVMIVLAVMAAYLLRFKTPVDLLPRAAGSLDLGALAYFKAALLLAGIWTIALWREGGYADLLGSWSDPLMELRTMLFCAAVALGACMAFSFAFRGESFALSRQVLILGTTGGVLFCQLLRLALRRFDDFMVANGRHRLRIAVIGSLDEADLAALQVTGVSICGRLRWHGDRPDGGSGSPVLGDAGEVEEVHRRERLDAILLAPGVTEQHAPTGDQGIMRLINFCEASGIRLYAGMERFGVFVSRREVGALAGMPLVRLRDACQHPVYGACKLVFDMMIALGLLVTGSPLWLLIALLVKLETPGPALYSQMRVGLHGKPFRMYKFRSMVQGAHERLRDMVDFDNLEEPVYNIRDDPRITRVGRWLRRTSLDEIPQLINVLKGEMSLVGPRPEVVELVERYNPVQARRLKARPGITGYQQVMSRGEPSLARRVELDLYYLKHQGALLDLMIILRTLVVIVRGEGLR